MISLTPQEHMIIRIQDDCSLVVFNTHVNFDPCLPRPIYVDAHVPATARLGLYRYES